MDVCSIDPRRAIIDAASTIAAVAEPVGMTDAGVLCHFETRRDLTLADLEQFELDVERELDLDGIRLRWFLGAGEVSLSGSVRAYVDHALERLAPSASVR